MANRILRDVEADGRERSDFPTICESCIGNNPYLRMTKADYDKKCNICTRAFTVFRWRPARDARYKKTEICQTCSKLKNVCQVCLLDLEYGLPVQVRAHVCSFFVRGQCTRGLECPYRHEMPETGGLSQQNIKDRYYGVNDPVALRTLYISGLDARISEQDLRDELYAHEEIESIKLAIQRACAFVTYTTREGAEKAAEEVANKLVIKGFRLKLLWGRPQAPKPESGAAIAHSGLLPRAVISQQNQPLQAPGTHDPPAMPYFNIPLPPQQERTYYPSMDPQRMGASMLHPSTRGIF